MPFHPRCPRAEAICSQVRPELVEVASTKRHRAACHFRDEPAAGHFALAGLQNLDEAPPGAKEA